ncbi:MAG: hypothetical protein ABII81_12370 [Pseudomonadota bacterium]
MYKLHNIALVFLIFFNPLLSRAESAASIPPLKTASQKVADKTASRAWEALRAGRVEDARYQFNQAFMFD